MKVRVVTAGIVKRASVAATMLVVVPVVLFCADVSWGW